MTYNLSLDVESGALLMPAMAFPHSYNPPSGDGPAKACPPPFGRDFLHRLRWNSINRCNHSFGAANKLEAWSALEWAACVCGEAGELANKVKKEKRGDAVSLEEITDEIADTIIYLDLLAARYGVDLETIITNKFNKTSEKIGSPYRL